MKSIELTAYCVREYDIKYTVVLDENDPIFKKFGIENLEDLEQLCHTEYRDFWNEIMLEPANQIKVDEDFAASDETYVGFEHFITENK